MNKKIVRADLAEDLYNSYSDKFGREEAARIIDHIILKMKNEVADGNTIELRGFGTLYAKKKKRQKECTKPKDRRNKKHSAALCGSLQSWTRA